MLQELTVVTVDQLFAQQGRNPHLAAALSENYPDSMGNLPMRYKYAWHHMSRGRYAELALLGGRMVCPDPRSGEAVVASRSWVLTLDWLCIAYEFHGVDPFFLITGSFDQSKLGIYFPEVNVLVQAELDEGWKQIGVAACNALRLEVAAGTSFLADEKEGAENDVPSCALHLGYVGNVGHFIWNDLSGIELALAGEGKQHIRSLQVGPHEYFPVEGVFPELAALGIAVNRWKKPLPKSVIHDKTLPLRIAGNRISLELRQRIVRWALQAAGQSLPAASKMNGHGINLWLNLRTHNKAWANQVQGIAEVVASIRQILRDDQTLTLFLDGTPDASALAEQIRDMTQGMANVVNATQVNLATSIVYASLIDLHVCVIGSGLTIPHWIMGRRGVAHSNRAHLSQQAWWNSIAEGAHDVLFIPESQIDDHDGPVIPDVSYVNYNMPSSAVIDTLSIYFRQINIELRRSAVSQMLYCAERGNWDQAARRVVSI